MSEAIHIIGGGLAGSEAAWQAAEAGARSCCTRCARCAAPRRTSRDGLAELVCSNSFRSDDWQNNAVGLLHEEMRRAGSLIMRAADQHACPPAARWRWTACRFRRRSPRTLEAHPNIAIAREEIAGLPPSDWRSTIIATGPLTSPRWPTHRAR